MPLSLEEIAEIIKLIDASSCDEFVVEVGDLKLAVRRKSASTAQSGLDISAEPVSASPSTSTTSTPLNTAPDRTPVSVAEHIDALTEVRSPMSGIFYRKPTPNDEPFVSVGSHVNKGDPLCLVEVMKLFTTVNAEQSGRIVEIAAEDGQQVEHNQILFLIERAKASLAQSE